MQVTALCRSCVNTLPLCVSITWKCVYECDFLLSHFTETNMATEVGRLTLRHGKSIEGPRSDSKRTVELGHGILLCGLVYNDLGLIIIYFSFTLDDVRVTGSYTDLCTESCMLPVCLF
jgi:hypothetical protein